MGKGFVRQWREMRRQTVREGRVKGGRESWRKGVMSAKFIECAQDRGWFHYLAGETHTHTHSHAKPLLWGLQPRGKEEKRKQLHNNFSGCSVGTRLQHLIHPDFPEGDRLGWNNVERGAAPVMTPQLPTSETARWSLITRAARTVGQV